MIRWVKGWWYARLRGFDLKHLWPACVKSARNIDHAKAAFAVHALRDPAWMVLGHDEVCRIIDNLRAP